MPPESKNTINDIQRKFGEAAVDLHTYKRQGGVVLVGEFTSRIGKICKLNENIGQYGEVTNIMNGEETLNFLKHNEMKTLNDRVKKAEPE
ncbi:hypothetical protein [Ekhidna sp.]